MNLVEDADGRRYALLKRSHQASLVLDLASGERSYRPNETLELIDAEPVPDVLDETTISQSIRSTANELLAVLAHGDAVPIRTVLEATTVCESELVALRGELEAAGLITTESVDDAVALRLTETTQREIGARDQS